MNAHAEMNTDFEALSQGAAYCQRWGGSFVLYLDGAIDDSFDTLEQAADKYADCWGEWETLKVLEFAPSGRSVDVTGEAREAVEGWCHARYEDAPWDGCEQGTKASARASASDAAYKMKREYGE